MVLSREEIMEIIPHRDPFLLVDEVLELEPGARALGVKHVREDDYWFSGHFPGEPIMPGVLMIEAIAQAGAVAVLSLPEQGGKTAYLGGVTNARFRRKVVPGDDLMLEVEIVKRRGPVGVGKGTAAVGGELACSCEITFVIG